MLPSQQLIKTSTVFPFKNGCHGNNGILSGKGAMPGHFYPSSACNMFSMNRFAYSRTASTAPANKPLYIADASSRTMMMRINAIGKSSINRSGDDLGFSKQDRNVVNHAIVKARRIGAAAPAKKGYYPK